MTITNKAITITDANDATTDLLFRARGRDPYSSAYSYTNQTSPTPRRLYHGWPTSATELVEAFVDEKYRLPDGGSIDYDLIPADIDDVWDSTIDLADGEAALFNERLRFPTTCGNWSGEILNRYDPNAASQPDYSGYGTTECVYYRAFRESGNAANSGNLKFRGEDGAVGGSSIGIDMIGAMDDAGAKVRVEIKLPSQSGWLDLGKNFPVGFTGADGEGCLADTPYISGSDVIWPYSSGTLSTANSGYMIIVRIRLRDTAIFLTRLEVEFN
jgi:hypothetical protein